MSTVLVPAVEGLCSDQVADSPFHRLVSLSRRDLSATRGLPAAQRRLLTEHFVDIFQWKAARPLLPLRLAALPDVPPWEPRPCRSFYSWLPPEDIRSTDDWDGLDDFDLILRLFDFSPWRSILAQRFRSHLGPPPFDPVSIGLAFLLARWRDWGWPQLLTELRSPERGRGYCRRLGFDPNDLPSESTFRMALGNTEEEWMLQCFDSLAQSLMAYGLIPTRSTFPGDPLERGVTVAPDSQLVAARSRMHCRYQNPRCFLPREQRTCAAREADKACPELVEGKAVPATLRPAPATAASPPPATLRQPTSTTLAPISPLLPPTLLSLAGRKRRRTPTDGRANTTSATRPSPSTSWTTAFSPSGP